MEINEEQYLHFFSLLRQGTNEAAQEATQMGKILLQSPDAIVFLMNILLNTTDQIIKKYATHYLSSVISKFYDQINNAPEVIEQLLMALSNEADPKLQLYIINAIDDLSNDESLCPHIFEFARNLAETGQTHSLCAAIQLSNMTARSVDDLSPYMEFFSALITGGMTSLEPKYPLQLALTIGSQISENAEFLNQCWETAVDLVIQNLDNEKRVRSIGKLLNKAMDPEDLNIIANPQPILEKFFPIVGNPELSFENNYILLALVSSALELIPEEQYEQMNPETFFPELLQKALIISAQAYNPEDNLAISRIDVFEDICVPFSDGELETSEIFINALLSMIKPASENEQTKPGIILALSYVVDDDSDTIEENFDSIIELITAAINDPVLLVRDCACQAMHEIACKYQNTLDAYLELLINSCLSSITSYGPTKDLIETMTVVFSSVLDTDPVFEAVSSLLIPQFPSLSESNLSVIISCLQELYCHSQKLVKESVGDMVPLLFSLFETQKASETGLLIRPIIEFLADLSTKEPELFEPYLETFIPILTSSLDMTDELKIYALQALGKLMDNYANVLAPLLTELIPKLLELGSRDLEKELRDGVEEMLANPEKILEEAGEISFDVTLPGEEEDDEDASLSPVALPALSLVLFSQIALSFATESTILQDSIAPAMAAFEIQMKHTDKDSLDQLCKAISLFARAISKTELPNKNDYSKQFADWMFTLVEKTEYSDVAFESIATLGQIIELFGVDGIGPDNLTKCIQLITNVTQRTNLEFMREKFGYVKELYEPFTLMICELISAIGGDAPTVLQSVIPEMYKYCTSKAKSFREIGIKIFGELVHKAGPQLPAELKENFLLAVINGIRTHSANAAFALNQYTNGAPEVLAAHMTDIMQLLLDVLNAPPSRGSGDFAFVDNVVAAVCEIKKNILQDQFPYDPFLPLCLANMPAQFDSSVNLDMMTFIQSIESMINAENATLFATILIKLFMKTPEQMGGIAEDDSGLLQHLAGLLNTLLGGFGQQAGSALIAEVCENDPIKMQRVKAAIQPPSA